MSTKVLIVGAAVSGGVIAALNEATGWAQVVTFKECPPNGRWEHHEPIAVGGKLWEPIVEEHAALDLLRGLAADGNVFEARIKAELPDLAPSGGHDALEELLGLLRVTRGQRDGAEKDAQAVRTACEKLAQELASSREELAVSQAKVRALQEDKAEPIAPDKATLSLFPEPETAKAPTPEAPAPTPGAEMPGAPTGGS